MSYDEAKITQVIEVGCDDTLGVVKERFIAAVGLEVEVAWLGLQAKGGGAVGDDDTLLSETQLSCGDELVLFTPDRIKVPFDRPPSSGSYTAVALSACNRWLATGTTRGCATLSSTTQSKDLWSKTLSQNIIGALCFSLNGERVVVAIVNQIWVLSVQDGNSVRKFSSTSPIDFLAISSTNLLVVANKTGLQFWENWTIEGGTEHCTHRIANTATSVALTKDYILAPSIGGSVISVYNLGTYEVETELRGHTSWVSCIAVSEAQHLAVSGSDDTALRVWDLKEFVCLREICGHRERIYSCSVSCCGYIVASNWESKEVATFWDVENGNELVPEVECVVPNAATFVVASSGDVLFQLSDSIIAARHMHFRSHIFRCKLCGATATASSASFTSNESVRRHVSAKHDIAWKQYEALS